MGDSGGHPGAVTLPAWGLGDPVMLCISPNPRIVQCQEGPQCDPWLRVTVWTWVGSSANRGATRMWDGAAGWLHTGGTGGGGNLGASASLTAKRVGAIVGAVSRPRLSRASDLRCTQGDVSQPASGHPELPAWVARGAQGAGRLDALRGREGPGQDQHQSQGPGPPQPLPVLTPYPVAHETLRFQESSPGQHRAFSHLPPGLSFPFSICLLVTWQISGQPSTEAPDHQLLLLKTLPGVTQPECMTPTGRAWTVPMSVTASGSTHPSQPKHRAAQSLGRRAGPRGLTRDHGRTGNQGRTRGPAPPGRAPNVPLWMGRELMSLPS